MRLNENTLPIVPIWNWNSYQSHRPWPSSPTNRTNLELKPIFCTIRAALVTPTNRTNLELKLYRGAWIWTRRILPIVPIWNWNTARRWKSPCGWRLPIVPIWNWNWNYGWRSLFLHELPIVPIWNWNAEMEAFYTWATDYQSYQSGIETHQQKLPV